MIDPAILHSLEPPMPPTRPEIVEEREWLSPVAEKAKRLAYRLVEDYERDIAGWLDRLRRNQQELELVAPHPDRHEFSEQAKRLIEDIEYQAERRAVSAARFSKRAKKFNKHWFSVDPSLGAVHRSFVSRIADAEQTAIDGLLEHALFLRALRAEQDPDARGGPVFDNPDDLGSYLRDLVAS